MAPRRLELITRREFLEGAAGGAAALTLAGCDWRAGTATSARRTDAPTPTAWKMSVCPYCGVGCGLEVGVAEGAVVAVRAMADHPVNKGEMCLLARHLVPVLSAPDRLLTPMVRRDGALTPTGWEEAIGVVAERIKAITAAHGPDAFAMYVSASEYLEEYYVYSKLVKGCLGTNNLESSARLCWASGVAGLVKAFGADSPPCAYDDLDLADLMFVSGYNLSAAKPVFSKRLLLARAKSGAKLIVADPRRVELAAAADMHLQLRPGTDVALHNALAHVLIKEELLDAEEARALTTNFDALAEHVAGWTPARAAEVTGLPAEQIVRAARALGAAERALFLWGQGLNQSSIGTRKVATLLNLAFITGNIGKEGAGPLAVTGQTSAMGLREVGALPHLLPGFRSVTDPEHRAQVAEVWGVAPEAISPRPGKTLPALLEAAEAGQLKALWVIHANPAATFPDTGWVRRVLPKLDLLVVQDCMHPTETSGFAHVLLPGATWAEKGGTMTNSERGLNLVEQAVTPPGQSRPDLDIVIDVAKALGFAERFAWSGTEAVFEEYKRLTRGRPCDLSGVSYARLRKDKGIQWPVPAPDHPGTKRRFLDRAFPRGKVMLGLYEHQEPQEVPDADYPLVLLTGLVAGQFHSRTRTGKVPQLARSTPEPFVEVNPADAARLKLGDGDEVRVVSRRGKVRVRLKVSDAIRPGAVFVPYHFGALAGADRAVNDLTNRAFDETAGQPEFQACAVRLEKA